VWPKLAPPFGHVAYVTGVEPDGSVDVAEYNTPGAARRFRFDRRDDVDTSGAVFIYVPKVGDAHGSASSRVNPARRAAVSKERSGRPRR
jgi:surface antigen